MKPESNTRRNPCTTLSQRFLLASLVLLSCSGHCRGGAITDVACQTPSYTACTESLLDTARRVLPEGTLDDNLCPEITYLAEGTSTTFRCRPTLKVTVEYIRFEFYPTNPSLVRDNKTVDVGSKTRFRNVTDNLEIFDIEPGDEGVYVCIVKENDTEPVVARPTGCLIVHSSLTSIEPESTESVSVRMGDDIVLDTTATFGLGGYCNVTPKIESARLAFDSEVIFECESVDSDCTPKNTDLDIYYDWAGRGNLTIYATPTFPNGSYIFAIEQCCPSDVLRMTYDVTSGFPPVSVPTTTTVPTSTVPVPSVATPGGNRRGDGGEGVSPAAIAVPLVLVVALCIIVVAFLIYFVVSKRRDKYPLIFSRDPVYEEPQKLSNKLPSPLERHVSDITLPPPPSHGMNNGHYGESVYLQDRVTDSEAVKV